MIKVIGYLCLVIMIYKGPNHNALSSVLAKIIAVESTGGSTAYSGVTKVMN